MVIKKATLWGGPGKYVVLLVGERCQLQVALL
jgi:hypothetical protein